MEESLLTRQQYDGIFSPLAALGGYFYNALLQYRYLQVSLLRHVVIQID